MPWSVRTAFIEPVALDPMARWSLESTITMVITEHRIATGESIALPAYIGLVALVLVAQQSSVGPIEAEADLTLTSLDLRKRGRSGLRKLHRRTRSGELARAGPWDSQRQ